MNTPMTRVGWKLAACLMAGRVMAAEPVAPSEWIDPATGHVIVRLSQEPGTASLYFHNNGYTPDGKKLVIVTPEGLATVNLQTHVIDLVVPGFTLPMSKSSGIEVSRKENVVYYNTRVNGQNVINATNLDTHATRQVVALPFGGSFGGLNSDDTFLVGDYTAGGGGGGGGRRGRGAGATTGNLTTGNTTTGNVTAGAGGALTSANVTTGAPVASGNGTAVAAGNATAVAGGNGTTETGNTTVAAAGRRGGRGNGGGGQTKEFFTVNIKTGEIKTFFPSPDNLNHVQSSPKDPNLFLYAHEGNWAQVDRIWTMHYDGTDNKLMHVRTMPNEIAGHEFFSHDGKWVYYDLQTPESAQFWIAGVNVITGERVRYPLERSQWSVHYNVSWDGKVFLGDGGGPNSVADRQPGGGRFDPPQNGQWMYLFTPEPGKYETIKVNGEDVKVGKLEVEKLADLSKHDYGNGEASRVEPNGTFTPDDKWIVFRSNMEGTLGVYEVEVAKATPEETKRITEEWAAYKAAVAKAASPAAPSNG